MLHFLEPGEHRAHFILALDRNPGAQVARGNLFKMPNHVRKRLYDGTDQHAPRKKAQQQRNERHCAKHADHGAKTPLRIGIARLLPFGEHIFEARHRTLVGVGQGLGVLALQCLEGAEVHLFKGIESGQHRLFDEGAALALQLRR